MGAPEQRQPAKPIEWLKRYSDSSEDYVLRMLFPYATGHYVEVGVWDPVRMSNTYVFYEMGWSGVLVEPMPLWARKVKAARPRDIVVSKAASDKPGQTTLKLESAASSIEPGWTTNEARRIPVTVDTLSSILSAYPGIRDACDFCSIDVEGHERNVLEGIDFSTFRPSAFILEAVRWNPFYRTHGLWEPILTRNGYKLVCHNLQNRVYGLESNEELWKEAEKWNLAE